MKKVSIKSILESVGDDYIVINEDKAVDISNVKPIDQCTAESLVWVAKEKINKKEMIQKAAARTVICDSSLLDDKDLLADKCLVIVTNPRLTFLRICEKLFISPLERKIHQTAIIHSEAVVGKNIYIGPYCYIGKSKIGDNSVIHGNCYIYDNVEIGRNVTVLANTVIGSDGFGYEKNIDGQWEKFPHVGGVIIEDFVEIGSNTAIDKGTLGNTVIKKGTKIDNLVHIAHNVQIGENSMIIANSVICGSTVIGSNVWVAPSATILDRLIIGNNVKIGIGSVVLKNVNDGETVFGNPALQIKKSDK